MRARTHLRYLLPTLLVLACPAWAAGPSVAATGPGTAPDPKGDWLVADGTAVIRIAPCADALCGTIAWTKGGPGGTDANNPDPAKRNRPIIGVTILIDMKPTPEGRYEGEVYNAENGKIYRSKIWLKADDVLRIEGCLLFFCGGEDWTRTKLDAAAPQPVPSPGPNGQRPKSEPAPRPK